MKKRFCLMCGQAVLNTGNYCGDAQEISVGKCAGCGLVQLMDFSHVSLDYYASDDYFPVDTELVWERESHWNTKRISILEQALPNPESRRILDFGCGIGGFLKRAQKKFKFVCGYDLSAKVVKQHIEDGFPCFYNLSAVPKNIDTIVLFHVLEHVERPWGLLKELKIGFPSVDRFIIETPCNEESLISLFENEEYSRNHYSVGHLYYFSNETLSKVAQKAGLNVIFNSQLQRYTLGNTLGWLQNGQGGGQNKWSIFNSIEFHSVYEKILVEEGVADSVFLICTPENSAKSICSTKSDSLL